MSNNGRLQGRAVGERPTIQFLTLPDGTKRRVASRPVGDPQLVCDWLTEIASENPNRWLDFRDLLMFLTGGVPYGGISKSTRNNFRAIVKNAKSLAIRQGQLICTKADKGGGVHQFKWGNPKDPQDRQDGIRTAIQDKTRAVAYENRVAMACETLEISDQFPEIWDADQKNKQRKKTGCLI